MAVTPRVALITGAGKRRIGAVIADHLARKGLALAIHYRTSEAEAKATVARYQEQSVEALAVQADLGEEQAVERMIQETLSRFGRIDYLINAAAVWGRKLLESVTSQDVRDQFDANTLGTFLCCQHAGLVMTKQPEGGCIVTIGDWACVRPYLGYAAYFASKGAIPTLTRTFAVELASRNPRVRVNCILPGPVMLPADLPEEERAQAINATLLKREGSPDNIAQAVWFLLENNFVTGVCLPVDGGRSIYAPD